MQNHLVATHQLVRRKLEEGCCALCSANYIESIMGVRYFDAVLDALKAKVDVVLPKLRFPVGTAVIARVKKLWYKGTVVRVELHNTHFFKCRRLKGYAVERHFWHFS